MLRTAIRYLLITVSIVFGGMSCLLLLMSGKQIHKNKKVLADFQDRVAAVRSFQKTNDRLPSKDELVGIFKTLPVRYAAYDYQLQISPTGFLTITNWPQSGGWALSFWRGEWSEYYTSWNDYYTLTEDSSWWGFCRWFLLCPFVAILIFSSSKLPIFRDRRSTSTACASSL